MAFQEAEVRSSRQTQEGMLHLEAQVRTLPAADAGRGNSAGRLHRQAAQARQGRLTGLGRAARAPRTCWLACLALALAAPINKHRAAELVHSRHSFPKPRTSSAPSAS